MGRGRCVYFINWFLVSEVTNFNMSLRWFLMKAKLENSKLYLWNGLTWLPLFFCIRVMVIPNLIDALLHSDWEVLTTGEKWTARLLLPIPMLLNTYWQVCPSATFLPMKVSRFCSSKEFCFFYVGIQRRHNSSGGGLYYPRQSPS